MRKILNYMLAAVAMVAVAMPVKAQSEEAVALGDSIPQSHLVEAYTDSLLQVRQRLDEMMQENRRLTDKMLKMNYLRLFSPLTFYHDIAGHRLGYSASQSAEGTLIDDALLSVYLLHPEWVTGTQRQLDAAGSAIEDTRPVATTPTNITEKAPALPDAPEADKVNVVVKKPNFWKFSGDLRVNINQLAFSDNWHQSHENNFNMLNTITLRANYNNKQKVKWDNTLELRLGMQTTKTDTLRNLRTTEDVLRYTGNVGLQAIKKWDYTFQVIATTQSLKGYPTNSSVAISDFFSPITVTSSLGMKYNINFFKNKLTGSVNIGALAYNWKYCGWSRLVTRYGIQEGHHSYKDYGSNITINTTFKFTNDISWVMRLYGYTSYKRALVEIENTFNFRVSKFLNTTLYFYPRFDDSRPRDDHHGYWAFKETLSFGLSYSF